MDKSVPKFHRASKGRSQAMAVAFFDRYCARRWGHGKAADRAAARRFNVSGKTIARWRKGETALPASVVFRVLAFEGADTLLDRVDPDLRG